MPICAAFFATTARSAKRASSPFACARALGSRATSPPTPTKSRPTGESGTGRKRSNATSTPRCSDGYSVGQRSNPNTSIIGNGTVLEGGPGPLVGLRLLRFLFQLLLVHLHAQP